MESKISKLAFLQLKVKVRSLAEESRIIRKLENDPCDIYGSLHWHRVWNVRNEARATQLAVAFLVDKTYISVEPKCKDDKKLYYTIVPRILAMAKKYGSSTYTKEDICAWLGLKI